MLQNSDKIIYYQVKVLQNKLQFNIKFLLSDLFGNKLSCARNSIN